VTRLSFVYFNFARELSSVLSLHCEPDTVKHEPRSFLSNFDGAVDFPRTNPVLTIRNHPHGSEPLVQAERRIFTDSPSLDGEMSAVVALVHCQRLYFS
jgi:hypothetical protein